MRCPDYDDPTKITDETADEFLCEYCGMRGQTCDGKGNISQPAKIKFTGMWYWNLWWLCDEDEDDYAHNFILSHMVRQENWTRPTWRTKQSERDFPRPKKMRMAIK